jgi:hypothetical protein
MPANFCLLPQYADELLHKMESGKLSLPTLARMSSTDRRATFAAIMGEANAEHVNAAFESKLLLQNQQKGLETWIKQTTGLKPEVERDLLARVARMDRVLEPHDATGFLADLAKQRLGFGVTMEEAGKIAELAKRVAETRDLPLLPNGDHPLEYGEARVNFRDYVAGLKLATEKRTVWGGVKNTAGLFKSLVATLDNSIIGRQGINVLLTDPKIWAKNSLQTFSDMYHAFTGEDVLRAVDSEIFSRKNFPDYQRGKLAVGVHEEAFPTTLPEKIPGVRRVYKANEAAFTAWQRRTRVDLFDKYKEIGESIGVPMDRKQVTELASIANSLTGRGALGKAEAFADEMNVFLFSGRKLAADLDVLTGHQLRNLADRAKGGEGLSTFSQRIAAENLAKVIAGTAVMIAIAKAVNPDTELDPRSATFGTAGGTVDDEGDVMLSVLADALGFGANAYGGTVHIDFTGGKRGIITLAARIAARSTKSGTTGRVTPFYSGGFGQRTAGQVAHDFAENKLSPSASFLLHVYTGQGRDGKPFDLLKEALALVTPASIGTARELEQERRKH